MIFSELYSAYYNAVAAVLTQAVSHPVSDEALRELVERCAFGESLMTIPDALREGRWQLLKPDGSTPLRHVPTLPLTSLQKQWLKAVACDPRIRLFGEPDFGLADVEPLFLPSDVIIFDKYADGDDYTDAAYIANFRLILDAIRKGYSLEIEALNKKDRIVRWALLPEYLEYSEKDDKFRLVGMGKDMGKDAGAGAGKQEDAGAGKQEDAGAGKQEDAGADRPVSALSGQGTDGYVGTTINLARIVSCKPGKEHGGTERAGRRRPEFRSVSLELTDRRNALERVLLHFAHFEKTAERIAEDKYIISIRYEAEDEIELVIRVLAFGPMLRVTEPPAFVNLIKERLIRQKSCGL